MANEAAGADGGWSGADGEGVGSSNGQPWRKTLRTFTFSTTTGLCLILDPQSKIISPMRNSELRPQHRTSNRHHDGEQGSLDAFHALLTGHLGNLTTCHRSASVLPNPVRGRTFHRLYRNTIVGRISLRAATRSLDIRNPKKTVHHAANTPPAGNMMFRLLPNNSISTTSSVPRMVTKRPGMFTNGPRAIITR